MVTLTEFYSDIIICAIEGGIGYWSVTLQYQAEAHAIVGAYRHDMPQTCAHISPTEGADADRIYLITPTAIRDGIFAILNGDIGVRSEYRDTIREADTEREAGDIDADLADVIVQAALFGEVRFS